MLGEGDDAEITWSGKAFKHGNQKGASHMTMQGETSQAEGI